jgi:cytochrome P450
VGIDGARRSRAERFKELYDVERHVMATDGGILVEDPYPAWAELRASPVRMGTVRELMGYDSEGGLGGAHHRTVYSAFSYQANNIGFRDNDVFSSTFYQGMTTQTLSKSMIEMVGVEHRRYRALAQPAFTPVRARWWIDNWIQWLVDDALMAFEHRKQAELNSEFCARIPLQTITSSFGLTKDEALDFREWAESGMDRGGGEGPKP